MLRIVETKHLSTAQRNELLSIWNDVYPAFMAYEDRAGLDKYLAGLEKRLHYLAQNESKRIVGWLATFNRDDQRWFLMIVDEDHQGEGIGSSLLRQAKQDEPELFGWVIQHNRYKRANGKSYQSPIGFYERHGFKLEKDIRFDNGRLKAVRMVWRNQ